MGQSRLLLPEPRISPKGWDGVETAGPRSILVCAEQGAGGGRGAVLGVLLGLGRGGSCWWRPPQKPQLSGLPCPTEWVPFLPMSPRVPRPVGSDTTTPPSQTSAPRCLRLWLSLLGRPRLPCLVPAHSTGLARGGDHQRFIEGKPQRESLGCSPYAKRGQAQVKNIPGPRGCDC